MFSKLNGNEEDLYSVWYEPDSGWATPEPFGGASTAQDEPGQVTSDNQGNFAVVWSKTAGNNDYEFWTDHYVSGSGWEAPHKAGMSTTITNGLGSIAMTGYDHSVVSMWMEITSEVHGAFYRGCCGFTDEVSVDPTTASTPTNYSYEIVRRGDHAVATWIADDTHEIWTNDFYTAFGTAQLAVSVADTVTIGQHAIAADDLGTILLTWYDQTDAPNSRVDARLRVYDYIGGTWGSTTTLQPSDKWGVIGDTAMNAGGDGIVVWQEAESGLTNLELHAASFVRSSGLGDATLVHGSSGTLYLPYAGVDGAGNALVVFSDNDGARNNLLARRYIKGVGWDAEAEPLEMTATSIVGLAPLAIEPDGVATIAWVQADGTDKHVWAARFE